MKPWVRQLIQRAAKGFAIWAAYAWAFEKLRRRGKTLAESAQSRAKDIGRSLGHEWVEDVEERLETLRTKGARLGDTFKQGLLTREEAVMEKKSGWSFFKVILVLGIIIAVAIFLLDRILPKPYREEDLEDAWGEPDEEETGAGEATMERPPAAEASTALADEEPPAAAEGGESEVSGNGAEEEKPKTTTRKKSAKKGDSGK
ncbi:MAG TPA: hypothetical protein ENI92_07155 [Bacteroidetes bacterium]|nr:hypothetical protein [Bacteroidota bacterium]